MHAPPSTLPPLSFLPPSLCLSLSLQGDGNPLWELGWTLCAALLAGLDCGRCPGEAEKVADEPWADAALGEQARAGEVSSLPQLLAAAALGAVAAAGSSSSSSGGRGGCGPLAAAYAACVASACGSGGGASGEAGEGVDPLGALAQLALALWAFSAFKVEPGCEAGLRAGAGEAAEASAALAPGAPWPPLRDTPCWDPSLSAPAAEAAAGEVVARCAVLAGPARPIHALARAAASPSFAACPLRPLLVTLWQGVLQVSVRVQRVS